MSSRVDLNGIRARAVKELDYALSLYNRAVKEKIDFKLIRYLGAMAAVDIHATWERFTEDRLIAALHYDPTTFFRANEIRGIKRLPVGLATILVRERSIYFDFRSTDALIDKADRLLGKSANPFRKIPADDRGYLETLFKVRNCIGHRSKLAYSNYKSLIRKIYGIRSAPEPEEFLSAIDRRVNSPARNQSRLHGLIVVTRRTILHI